MKVKMIKDHPTYKGTVDVDDARGNYLISVGAAKEVKKEADKPKEKESPKAKK